jgi:hypothetical protein
VILRINVLEFLGIKISGFKGILVSGFFYVSGLLGFK